MQHLVLPKNSLNRVKYYRIATVILLSSSIVIKDSDVRIDNLILTDFFTKSLALLKPIMTLGVMYLSCVKIRNKIFPPNRTNWNQIKRIRDKQSQEYSIPCRNKNQTTQTG